MVQHDTRQTFFLQQLVGDSGDRVLSSFAMGKRSRQAGAPSGRETQELKETVQAAGGVASFRGDAKLHLQLDPRNGV